jgi:predicted phosphodiesterase
MASNITRGQTPYLGGSLISFTTALKIVSYHGSDWLVQATKVIGSAGGADTLTKVAIISDVHANLEALEEVLRQVRGVPIYCLGDLVDYGANPNEVVERVRQVAEVVILGNHDHAAVTGDTTWFNPQAAISSAWTRKVITGKNLEFLRGLQQEWRFRLDQFDGYLAHGSPDNLLWEYVFPWTHQDLFGHYLDKVRASMIGLGHTHIPYVWREGQRVVFNPGSVGQPRDGDRRASFAIIDATPRGIAVEIRRVEYDIEGAASKILEAGLPASHAERLATGT